MDPYINIWIFLFSAGHGLFGPEGLPGISSGRKPGVLPRATEPGQGRKKSVLRT
jgi:hypothetical protein